MKNINLEAIEALEGELIGLLVATSAIIIQNVIVNGQLDV